ncbi:MAG: flagellar basal body P-ring formation protein FlgA [Parvularculaceae bacterium]|nr:MAG: flagellar basal body P-ring formation protein FlgA [Parvularculaceae bacterium]
MTKLSQLLITFLLLLTPGFVSAAEMFAARNISAGEILLEGDLINADEEIVAAESLIGLETRRSLYKGAPVFAGMLRAPILVKRNAIVAMEFRSGPLVIRSEGRALQEGANGDIIRVMNLGSRTTITATVNGGNSVRVVR